jgi:hypothetical protein
MSCIDKDNLERSPLEVIFMIGAAKSLLLYCDVEPEEVPFDGEFEGTYLVAGGECLSFWVLFDCNLPSVHLPPLSMLMQSSC